LRVSLTRRACFSSLLLGFAAVILSLSLGLGRVARLVPLAVVVPTLLLLLFQLLMDLLPGLAEIYSRLERKDLFGVQEFRQITGKPGEESEDSGLRGRRERRVFLWLFALPGLIYLLGLLLAIPLFTLFYLKGGSEKWLTAMAIALAICCLIFALSLIDSGARLYEGLLWNWLSRSG
jgi:hypothetical protein